MTKSSLNSHPKDKRLFLYLFLGFTLLVVLINLTVSVILNQKLNEIRTYVTETKGFSFSFKFAYFNLFEGLTLAGVKVEKDADVCLNAHRVDIGFDVLSLRHREIRIKNIRLKKAYLNSHKIPDLLFLGSQMAKKIKEPVKFYETAYFKGSDLWLDDIVQFDLNGYFSSVKGNLLISRGEFLLKTIRISALPDFDVFRGSSFLKPLDYVFEAESQEKDFLISRFELSNPFLKFAGSGRIQNFTDKANVDFTMNFMNIVLDDFPALNSEHLHSRGVLESVLKVTGPASDPKTLLKLNVANAEFNFFDSIFVTDVNGEAILNSDHLIGKDFSLKINRIPFKTDFSFYQAAFPHLEVELSSLEKIKDVQSLVVDMAADWNNGELVGDLKAKVRTASAESANSADLDLKDFHLGYEEDLYLNARDLGIHFVIESSADKKSVKTFSSDLALQDLLGILRRKEDGFLLDHLKAYCYGGTLEGLVDFTSQGEEVKVKGEAHLRGVDLGEFFKSPNESSSVMLGKLEGDLRFDNRSPDMFKGQLFIADGRIEGNPLLNAVADFLGVSSLKKLSFSELSMFFNGGRGEYASTVKLQSSQVSGSLDGKIIGGDKMDGYLSATISSQLLNESKQFKRLLTYIRHDEPSVVFSFKISSYISSPRVLWLKNQFKEKVQTMLPESNKRFLQRQVNSMVEKIEGE